MAKSSLLTVCVVLPPSPNPSPALQQVKRHAKRLARGRVRVLLVEPVVDAVAAAECPSAPGVWRVPLPYDAAAAQAAADSLVEHATTPDWAVMWPEGSAQGEVEDSEALPAIWENPEDFQAKHQALIDAVTAMQGAAGTELAAVQASLGAVGASCGGCHETYRAADD